MNHLGSIVPDQFNCIDSIWFDPGFEFLFYEPNSNPKTTRDLTSNAY